jgi:hypothetical protein
MPISVICWNCDYFNTLNVGVDNSGQCRRRAPRGIDTKSIPLGVSQSNVFPYVEDGTEEMCGEFKLNTGVIPAPVVEEE